MIEYAHIETGPIERPATQEWLDNDHDAFPAHDDPTICGNCGYGIGTTNASEIVSVCGVNPTCDICGEAQQPEDEWNGETGNHVECERK